ncbi:MAG: YjbQ family protein [Phycisphaerae bacterium]|nr:YjbQ family protein [Phycisphaerae bacterium]
MQITHKTISVRTNRRCQMIDITSQVAEVVSESGIQNGTAMVFCPHTTAAITINENADPDVQHDLLLTLEELLPKNRPGYRHCEGNSDAHVKTSLVGTSELVMIQDGRLTLGTWQSVFFCEFDGPRSRTVYIQITGQ